MIAYFMDGSVWKYGGFLGKILFLFSWSFALCLIFFNLILIIETWKLLISK